MDHMVWLDTTWAWHSAVHTEMRAVQLEMPCDNQWTSWTSRKKNKPARSRLDHFLPCWLFLCCGYCCLSVAGLGTIRVLLGFVSLCYIFNASQQFFLPHNNNGRLRKKCHLSTANKSFRNKWATKVFFFFWKSVWFSGTWEIAEVLTVFLEFPNTHVEQLRIGCVKKV